MDVLINLTNEIPMFRVLSLGSLRRKLPLRTQRIAYCRNAYLAELESNPQYCEVDYVIVADVDGANGLVAVSGLSSCWSRSAWDVCTANQRGPYYDIWALRHSLWSPNDCWQQCNFLTKHGVRLEAAKEAAVYSRMVTIDEYGEWVEVESAFGGFAVYRRAVLAGVRYEGLSSAGLPVCEHIALHQQIKANGGRIFINPRMINTGSTDHSLRKPLPSRSKLYWSGLQILLRRLGCLIVR